MFWLFAIGAIFVAIFGYEFYFPVYYRIRARQAGCGYVPVKWHRPLGIPYIRDVLRSVKQGTLLEHFSSKQELIARTIISQRLFNFPIVTIEPENVKTILGTKFSDFSLGLRYQQMSPAFGDGIFTLDGSGWQHSRALLRPQFTREQVSQLLSINEHVDILISIIDARQKHEHFLDMNDLFHELTMDTSSEFFMGHSLGSLEGTSSHLEPGQKVTPKQFEESHEFVMGYVLQRLYLSGMYFLKNSKEFKEHIQRCRDFISFHVDEAVKQVSEGRKPERYRFSYALAENTNDAAVIRDQLYNIFVAGRDTTAGTLTFLFYHLASNPGVRDKLRNEIRRTFSQAPQDITFEQLKSCKYLNQVIDETLRLSPQAPVNFRTAVRDTSLPLGGGVDGKQPVFVPKGTEVCFQSYTMHRDPSVFGPDAHEFKPERWDHIKNLHPWQYIPFNGGPRICIGQQFAKTELSLVVVRLLLEYDAVELPEGSPVEPPCCFALTVHTGRLPLRFIRH